MIVPVVRVAAAEPPSAQSAQPTATVTTASGPPTSVCTAKPTAAIPSRPARLSRIPIRCASTGLSIGPAIASSDAGTDSTPASSGESPSTSCRYWLIRMNEPKETKTFSTLLASETLNARLRKRVRSSIGSAKICWRRMKLTARPMPTSIESTGNHVRPS